MRRTWLAWPLCIPLLLLANPGTPAPSGKTDFKIRKVDTYVVGDPTFVPGSQASLRVVIQGATGLVASRPIPLARVSLAIRGQKYKERNLFRGRSDLLGIVEARFGLDHIDRPPLGDVAATVWTLIVTNPKVEVEYVHAMNGGRFRLNTKELKETLGTRSLGKPGIAKALRKYIDDNEARLAAAAK